MSIQRYALVFLAIALGTVAFWFIVKLLTGVDIGNGGMLILPAMGAAALEGQKYAKAENKLPDNRYLWRFALRCGAVALAFAMLSVMLVGTIDPRVRGMMGDPQGATFLFLGVFVMGISSCLISRLFLSLGVKTQLKTQNSSR